MPLVSRGKYPIDRCRRVGGALTPPVTSPASTHHSPSLWTVLVDGSMSPSRLPQLPASTPCRLQLFKSNQSRMSFQTRFPSARSPKRYVGVGARSQYGRYYYFGVDIVVVADSTRVARTYQDVSSDATGRFPCTFGSLCHCPVPGIHGQSSLGCEKNCCRGDGAPAHRAEGGQVLSIFWNP